MFYYARKKKNHLKQKQYLVGGWTNPSEKYARQIGSFPQVGVKKKHIWNHQLVLDLLRVATWKNIKHIPPLKTKGELVVSTHFEISVNQTIFP